MGIILSRRDTSAGFISTNPVLAVGEIGHETDTEASKIGDGVTAWVGLPYSWADPVQATYDTVSASLIGNPKTATATALNATYVAYKPGNHAVAFGDSVTQMNSLPGLTTDSYATYANILTSGQLNIVANSGVGGDTTEKMLARIQTDVVAKLPNGGTCLILCGTNDAGQAVPILTTISNVKSIVSFLTAAKIEPVFCTIPPRGLASLPTPSGVAAVPSTTGGTLAAGTYGYRITSLNFYDANETLASTTVTATTTGSTGSVSLTWTPQPGSSSYKVYGRTPGAEVHLATVHPGGTEPAYGVARYVDTGSVTPSGALPSSNTTSNSGTVATAPIIAATAAINNWIVRYCASSGYSCIDTAATLTDPSTGKYISGYSQDGVHPQPSGSRIMGAAVAKALAVKLPQTFPYISTSNVDTSNLVTNGLFMNVTGNLPTGWVKSGGPATTTVGAVAGIVGNALTISGTDGTSQAFLNAPDITAGFAVGDLVAVSFMYQALGLEANGPGSQIGLRSLPNYKWLQQFTLQGDVSGPHEVYFEALVPAGVTSLEFQFNTGTLGAGWTVTLGQLTVRNLTAQGIA